MITMIVEDITMMMMMMVVVVVMMTAMEGRKCFDLTTHSTHFIYGHMAPDIW